MVAQGVRSNTPRRGRACIGHAKMFSHDKNSKVVVYSPRPHHLWLDFYSMLCTKISILHQRTIYNTGGLDRAPAMCPAMPGTRLAAWESPFHM